MTGRTHYWDHLIPESERRETVLTSLSLGTRKLYYPGNQSYHVKRINTNHCLLSLNKRLSG